MTNEDIILGKLRQQKDEIDLNSEQLENMATQINTPRTGGISFYIPGNLTTGINQVGFVCPCAMTIVKCIAKVTTPPTGASLIADVHKNGTTIFTTQASRPTINAAGTSTTTVAPDVTTLAEGDLVTLDVDQIGSTIAGANLAIVVEVLPVLS